MSGPMAMRGVLGLAAIATTLVMMCSNAGARDPERRTRPAPIASEHDDVTGIRTDRLSKRQLKVWQSIMEIVLAKDKESRPAHPKL